MGSEDGAQQEPEGGLARYSPGAEARLRNMGTVRGGLLRLVRKELSADE